MQTKYSQINLFDDKVIYQLPVEYVPIKPSYFDVSTIFLARGSITTDIRQHFVKKICNLYPNAKILECIDTPHNKIELGKTDILSLHNIGKKTLVFSEIKTAIRYSSEQGNTCPNYWHFSPYGFCPYGCKYCYLAGTQGVKFSPTVKIYLNLPEMLQQIDQFAMRYGKTTAFYLGKLQDPLALDTLTAYSTVMIPFFAKHPFARLILLTKSTNVERLIEMEHYGHTILSWSINPTEVCKLFEENVPNIEDRMKAMKLAISAGYPVRAVMMPIIPIDNWQMIYSRFITLLLETVYIQRLTLGGICIYSGAKSLMERKIGSNNIITRNIDKDHYLADKRDRYSWSMRKEIYSLIINQAHKIRPDLNIALCLESKEMWQALDIVNNIGHCNCVLNNT